MTLLRLGFLCTRGFNQAGFNLAPRLVSRISTHSFLYKSENQEHNNSLKLEEEDKPIPYSQTKAATHLAKHSRMPPENAYPHQGRIIVLSFSIILIYFCILREENDIDDMLRKPLSELIPNIEQTVGNVPHANKTQFGK